MFGIMNLFSDCIGIDLGTVNTVIAIKGQGIVLREPSAVAVAAGRKNEVLAVGNEAIAMLGRTPGSVTVVYPLKNGVVTDFTLAETMLKSFITMAVGRRLPGAGVRAVVCVPGCMSDVERRSLEEALRGAGAREAYLMDEPVAAAIGAGLQIDQARGVMIVDIGGGTTDVAVLALGGTVVSRSIRVGGTDLDEAIIHYIRQEHGLIVGASTAERLKLTLGSALSGEPETTLVRGRDVQNGLPCEIKLSAGEICYAMKKPVAEIVNAVLETLERTPPEISGDLLENGITLSGGTAQLRGLTKLIAHETGIPVALADDPLDCVALGALTAVENLRYYRSSNKRGSRITLPG
ncbi:MAG: rod shape-determining protein [Bacillota bacterium]